MPVLFLWTIGEDLIASNRSRFLLRWPDLKQITRRTVARVVYVELLN